MTRWTTAYADTYETFEFTPDSANYGSFNVNVSWADPRVDFDLYVYRIRPDGGIVAASVASSAVGRHHRGERDVHPAQRRRRRSSRTRYLDRRGQLVLE